MTTLGAIIGGTDYSDKAIRIEIWRVLSEIGTFNLVADNQNGDFDSVVPDDTVELKINGVSLLKGYVDSPEDNIDDMAEVFRDIITIRGRDMARDLANIQLSRVFKNWHHDSAIQDALYWSDSELSYSSPNTGDQADFIFKDDTLLTKFQEIAKTYDRDFLVQDDKVLDYFVPGARDSGVTLQSVAGGGSNNILSLPSFNPKDGTGIFNWIKIKAGNVKDHWTEEAARWTAGSGCTLDDEETILLAGQRSLKVTRAGSGVYEASFVFPNSGYSVLDFSVASEVCKVLVEHNGLTYFYIRIRLTDTDNEVIQYKDEATYGASGVWLRGYKWHKIEFPVGWDLQIQAESPFFVDGIDKNWCYVSGSSFNWASVKKITVTTVTSMIPGDIFIDGLELPVEAIALSEDAVTSQILYHKRMKTVQREDIKSVALLEEYADSYLLKMKDPINQLKVYCIGNIGLKYAGELVGVYIPGKGIEDAGDPLPYRILSLHTAAEPGTDILRGHDFVNDVELISHTVMQPTDVQRFRLASDPYMNYLSTLAKSLKYLANR